MQPTLLANSWMAAHLPGIKYMALLCAAGSAGEAAFHNSLDEAFAEVGHGHLPTTLNHRRPPTYQVVGTVVTDCAQQKPAHPLHSPAEVCTTTRRIARQNPDSDMVPTVEDFFPHAQVFTNASTVDINIIAVVLDLGSLAWVKALPAEFMLGSFYLKTIKLPPNIEQIGPYFLAGCASLTELDMSSLVELTALPDFFMSGCMSLVSIRLPPNVIQIGRAFMIDCKSLTSIDLSSLVCVTILPDRFMRGCTSLASVQLPPNTIKIGSAFLGCCPSLSFIDLSTLAGLVTLPDEFMRGSNLTSIRLPPNINDLGRAFMADCAGLISIDMSTLMAVSTLPEHFMRGCTNLSLVSLPPNIRSPPRE